MATIVERSIGTLGRDYASITLWEAAAPADLVAVDQVWKGVCYNDSVFTESVIINGSVSDATRYKWLTVADGNRHNGTRNTGSRIQNPTSTGTILRVGEPYAKVEGLEVNCAASGGGYPNGVSVEYISTNVLEAKVSRCLIYDGQFGGILIGDHCIDTIIDNNIVMNCGQGAPSIWVPGQICVTGSATTARTVKLYNNTVYKGNQINNICVKTEIKTYWTFDIRNCHAYTPGTSKQDFCSDIVYAITSDYNISSDTTSYGTHSLDSKSASNQFYSLVSGFENLHLKTGSDAIDYGENLTSLGNNINIDIDWNTRTASGAWDCGAAPIGVSSSGSLPLTGLTLHLESDANVMYDAAGVSVWGDQSSAAFPSFVQAADANKPSRVTNCFGTKPGLYFDGTSEFLESSGVPSLLLTSGDKDIFIVFRPVVMAGAGNYSTAPSVLAATNGTMTVGALFAPANAWFGAAAGVVNYSMMLKGKSYLLEFYGSSGAYVVTNKIIESLTTNSGVAGSAPTATGTTVIGKAASGATYATMYIGAIIVYDRVLTEKERYDTKEYLRVKYNATVPHVFVDGSMADDTSTDPKMTTAHKFYRTAITKYSGYFGTRIVLRRTIEETIDAAATPTGNASEMNPITVMGFPRNEITGLTGTFTQGSRAVSSVSGLSLSTRAHETRWITAPDSRLYRISCVTGTGACNLFTPYIGADSIGGTFKINKDELYDEIQTLTAYDGADDLATWNADSHNRPQIGQPASNFALINAGTVYHWVYRDLYLLNTRASYGINSSARFTLIGVTIESSVNGALSTLNGLLTFDGLTMKGTIGAVGTQDGFLSTNGSYGKVLQGQDLSIYGMSRSSLYLYYADQLNIVNGLFGADGASYGTREILTNTAAQICRAQLENCLFSGGTEIYNVGGQTGLIGMTVLSKHHNQVKDYHKLRDANTGTILTNFGSGVTLRNASNCSYCLEALMNVNRFVGGRFSGNMKYRSTLIFEHKIRLSELKTYRVYINSVGYLSPANAFLEIEYVDSYTGTSLHTTLVKSTGEILPRTGESDWTQFLEAPSTIQPAVESEVVVRMFLSYYHATNKIYVDPYIDGIGIAPSVIYDGFGIHQKYTEATPIVFTDEMRF